MLSLRVFIFLSFLIVLQIETTHAQWQRLNGSTGILVNTIVVSPNGTGGENLFAGTSYDYIDSVNSYGGVFRYTDNDTTWTKVNSGLTNTRVSSLVISPTSGGSGSILFAGTNRGVFLSANEGTVWTQVNSGLTDTSVVSLAVSGTDLFAGTVSHGIFLSTNNGTSWSAVNTGLSNTYVTSFAVSLTSGGSDTNIFAGTWGSGIFLSTNNGASWSAVNSGLENTYIRFLKGFETNLFAGTSGGVFLSTNNGTSWVALGLPNNFFVDDIAVSGKKIFIGGVFSVFLSTNNGTSWTEVNSGLPKDVITTLVVSGTTLFAGTQYYSVWKRPLNEMITSVRQIPKDTPKQFYLAQNYPNPFNPNTIITYQLPFSCHIRLEVFDLIGKEIAIIVDEEKNAGIYQVKFDATDLSSGIYFYQIRAGNYMTTKKFVLVK